MNVIKGKMGAKENENMIKIKKKWFLVEICSNNINHDIFSYATFNEDYDNKNLFNYNMSLKKYQEYYTKKMLTDNNKNLVGTEILILSLSVFNTSKDS